VLAFSITTSLSPAVEPLLNNADTANINTANITVVSLIPRDDDLFITQSYVRLYLFIFICTYNQSTL